MDAYAALGSEMVEACLNAGMEPQAAADEARTLGAVVGAQAGERGVLIELVRTLLGAGGRLDVAVNHWFARQDKGDPGHAERRKREVVELKEEEEEEEEEGEGGYTDGELAEAYGRVLRARDEGAVRDALEALFAGLSPAEASPAPPEPPKKKKKKKAKSTACDACFTPFAEDPAVRSPACGHAVLCADCFGGYVAAQMRDPASVVPWVRCPAADCRAAVPPRLFVPGADPALLRGMALEVMRTRLARLEDWVDCTADGCGYGFLLPPLPPDEAAAIARASAGVARGGKKKRGRKSAAAAAAPPPPPQMRCGVCGLRQKVVRAAPVLDDGFQEMIADGRMRPCPRCEELHFKEKGICNVLRCDKCGVWWNWATRETGNSSTELKQRARARGTLWQPGELEYQQRLQMRNPEEFRKLLERNGVRYDPNYRRGT